MEKEFITYDLALRMKEIGFDEPCFVTIDQTGFMHLNGTEYPIRGSMVYHEINVPTWQSAFKWFRDNYGVHMTTSKYDETQWWVNWGSWTSKVYDSYEEAQKSCLEKLCEIVENIKN